MRDKLEENPNFGAELDLINPEHGGCVKANIGKKLALKYQTKLHNQDNKLFSHFAKHRINAGKLYTCDNAFIKLSQILRS